MAAFEKVESGIPQFDTAIDYIRLGDNVVWQVDTIDTFLKFAMPYVEQAIRDKRNLIYIRFAGHPAFLEESENVKVYRLDPEERFELFTVKLHEIIGKEGCDAFYLFDCLSDLQVAWSTDLMMGNFFRVTCPYLFELDTVAFFPILRGHHSFSAIAKIRDTTQLLFDAFDGGDCTYVQPLKVWNRYLPTMFMPHEYCEQTGSFTALTEGVRASRFYRLQQEMQRDALGTEIDSWDRFFARARLHIQEGHFSEEEMHFICNEIMTRDEHMRPMVEHYFTPEDYMSVRGRMVGTGMIGGKACGMLLARKIIETELPGCADLLEAHDSCFIGSDVFYSYLVENDCWRLRVRQRTGDLYYDLAPVLQKKMEEGVFPNYIREQFMRLLDAFGQTPIIVRSSSILEDGFGNAFAGKYESVFCPNVGSPEERLERFEEAVRIVYASTMNLSVLEYRRQRGMEQRDEQMALLVQRVSGSYLGQYYMPSAAGVGFSFSTYRFVKDMDASKGMLRLVMGLGTKAVDRTVGDYPRLVSLDAPGRVIRSDCIYRHKFSQHNIEVVDLGERRLKEMPFDNVLPLMSAAAKSNILNHDYDTEMMFRESGQRRDIFYVGFDNLLRNELFVSCMRSILAKLQEVYRYPVDIEYTINISDKGDFLINLLQCRPLQTYNTNKSIAFPEAPDPDRSLFLLNGSSMGDSRHEAVSHIIYVDPYGYYTLPYKDKPYTAVVIEKINRYIKGLEGQKLLMTPGRIGTSSPELGVPVSFGQISGFGAICEMAYSKAGYMPELSYGSHMFQDLVEAGILYAAIPENNRESPFKPELLDSICTDVFPELFPEEEAMKGIIRIYRPEGAQLYHDYQKEKTLLIL